MKQGKKSKFTVKNYKTVKGRQLFFIKNKTKIKSCYFDRNLRLFQYKSDDPNFLSYSIKYKYSMEDVEQAAKQVANEKTKKKQIWSWLFLALNIVVVAVIMIQQFTSGDAISIADLIKLEDARWGYLVVAVLLAVAGNILESTKTFELIYISTHRFRPCLSYKSTALCRYYDCISPMSTAGEPFQIYYLNNRGIRGEIAASIPIVKAMFWQISNVILGVLLLVFNAKAYATSNPIIISAAWTAVAISTGILLTVLFLSVSKTVAPRIVIGILKLLAKIKLIKNYQLVFRKVMRFVINYQNCMRTFASNFGTIIIQLILGMGELLVGALIPYFIYKTFVPMGTVSAIDIVTMTFICNLISSIIPLPGGTGAVEVSFMAMFSSLFNTGTVVWAMLIWRILSYYLLIAQGITVTIYDTLIGNKKNERLVKAGYFNEKIHFAMIKRKRKNSKRIKIEKD